MVEISKRRDPDESKTRSRLNEVEVPMAAPRLETTLDGVKHRFDATAHSDRT